MLDISTISNPHCLFVSDEYHADELCELWVSYHQFAEIALLRRNLFDKNDITQTNCLPEKSVNSFVISSKKHIKFK